MISALSEFVSAGFVITRLVARSPYVSADLLPPQIVSASPCIASFIPDTWCIEWTCDSLESRVKKAQAFDLDMETLSKLTAWITPQFDTQIGWPNILWDYHFAIKVVQKFLSGLLDVKVLELALHESSIDRFCSEAEPPPSQPGFAPNGRQGVHSAILKKRSPTAGGTVLGFEPLVFNQSLSCSWLCNGLDTLVAEKLGIHPNSYGMISQFNDACHCIEYISGDDVGAEPGLWLPWLMIEHPHSLESAAGSNSTGN